MPTITTLGNLERNEANALMVRGAETRMKLYGAAVEGANLTFDRRNNQV